MFRTFDCIEIVNGDLCLHKGGVGKTYPCPFAYPKPCGTWCVHFGEADHSNGDPRLDYILTLGCCGTLLMAKEYKETELDLEQQVCSTSNRILAQLDEMLKWR